MPIIKILNLSLLIFLCTEFLYGQEEGDFYSAANLNRISEVLPPSPNAASLGNYGNATVGLVNGSINYTIDVATLKTANITLPISLSYSTTGFRVNQVASQIGLDWILNLGGVINRTVYDAPDDLSTRVQIPSNLNYNQATYNFLNAEHQDRYDFDDLQPDIFQFNFLGYSGKFILNSNLQPILVTYSDLKIESNFLRGGTGPIEEGYTFKITTPNGTVCYFGKDAIENGGTSTFGNNSSPDKDFSIAETAFYLRKIVHPNGDSIVFYYSGHQYYYLSDIQQSSTRRIRQTEYYSFCGDDNHQLPNPQTEATTVIKMFNEIQRLDSVVSSSGDHLKLTYSSRTDLPGSFLLNNILLYNSASPSAQKYFQFTYTIQASTAGSNLWNQNDASCKQRAFLNSFIEKDFSSASNNKVYKFQYNDLDHLPMRLAYGIDYWGYYNGASNSSLLYISNPAINNSSTLEGTFDANANRNPNADFSKKGILSKIIYPTGGVDSIIYEANTYSGPETIKTNVQDVNIKVQGVGNSDATPLLVQQSFTPNQNQTVTMDVASNYIGEEENFEPEYYSIKYSIYDNTSSHYLQDVDPNSGWYLLTIQDMKLDAGNNIVKSRDHGVNLQANHNYTISIKMYGLQVVGTVTLHYQNFSTQTITTNHETGGVRVARIISDSKTGASQIKRYYYTYPEDTSLSSLTSAYAFADFNNINKGKTVVICSSQDCGQNYAYYYGISSSPKVPISLYNGGNVAYPCVLESLGEHFENGCTEHLFQTIRDLPTQLIVGNQLTSGPTSNEDWEHGLELMTKKLKLNQQGQFITVEERKNSYKIDSTILNNYQGLVVRKNFPDKGYGCNPTNTVDDVSVFDVGSYAIQQRWIYNDSSYLISYDQQNPSLNTRLWTSHAFENPVHAAETKISRKDSKGDITYIKKKYVEDFSNYATNSTLNNLYNLHFTGVPIEELLIRKQGNADYVIGGKLLLYKNQSGKILLDKILRLNISSPVLYSSYQQSHIDNAGALVYDSRFLNDVIFDTYNNTGNILQQHKVNDVNHSYLWGYNNTYPIAEAINSGSNEIYATSFEEGGWDANLSYSTAHVHSGDKAGYINKATSGELYSFATQHCVVNLTTAKKFHYSGWVYSGGPSTQIFLYIKSTSGVISTDNIYSAVTGKWTLLQKDYTVPAGTAEIWLRVDNNGSGQVWYDDLRLHPSDAQMTTYTYQPLVGMTSKSDANNRVTYYAYDGFGRLSSVKDQDGNIIKTYCYNYAGQLTDCRTPFQNIAQSKTFIKNDCTDTSSSGSEVEAMVTMGTFTSDSSQEEADAMANAYLDSTGQSYANTHGECLSLTNILMDNYEHVAGFTIQLTSVYDSTKVYTISFPEDADSTVSLQRIPQGHYNIVLSKTDNTQSFLFTVSGPAGEIQVNSNKGSWNNVPVNLNTFYRVAIGILNQ